MSSLRDYLLDTYEFADSRRRNCAGDVSIRIDDRDGQDVVSSFCSMRYGSQIRAKTPWSCRIQHIPLTEKTRCLIKDQGGRIREFAGGYAAEITLSVKSVTFIRKLARTIGQTTGRGKRYDQPQLEMDLPANGRFAGTACRRAHILQNRA